MPAATPALFLVFALSGAAALIFETLFFRLAGLALGNSVYAAAIVLFSFMSGLGLGHAVAARFLRRRVTLRCSPASGWWIWVAVRA